jgi:plastocyanin
MLKIVPALLFLGAAAFVSTSNLRDARADAAAKSRVVTVHAKEFAFDIPKSIPAGPTTFRLVNDGKESHHLSIIKLEQGKTIADFGEALKGGAPPEWAVAYGGPNAAVPGQTIAATIDMEPGNYVVVCFIPSPGEQAPHAMKGMIAPLTVTAGGVAQAGAAAAESMEDPKPDLHLVMKEYGYQFSKPVTAGKHTIHVMNIGTQEHEAALVKLAPGKSMKDFDAWLVSGMKGPAPADPAPGMAGLGKGRTGSFDTNLTAGRYGVICWIPDAKDGKPHSMHGMVQEFTVAAK